MLALELTEDDVVYLTWNSKYSIIISSRVEIEDGIFFYGTNYDNEIGYRYYTNGKLRVRNNIGDYWTFAKSDIDVISYFNEDNYDY